ncbi:MAG: hypothetical protein KDM91_03370 [Verrucomicrobiae bacterium]|nr:hypothetical protein [Verrucomicrobiae bacterium]MCP5541597.1 hypothetical protein [Akkermansiaceae bacterium]MCP5550209.1 hypothetical protein [Akkermansiaceae bacterium]
MNAAPEDTPACRDFDPARCCARLRGRPRAVAAAILLPLGIGAAWIFAMPKIYEATAWLEVLPHDPRVLDIDGVVDAEPDEADFLRTVEIKLRRASLFERVMETEPFPSRAEVAGLDAGERAQWLADRARARLVRQTRLVSVTVEDRDPDLATKLAAAIVDAFLDEETAWRRDAAGIAREFLNEEAARVHRELDAAEEALREMEKARAESPDPEPGADYREKLREADAARDFDRVVRERGRELEAAERLAALPFRLAEPARASRNPVRPDRFAVLAVSLVAAAFLVFLTGTVRCCGS